MGSFNVYGGNPLGGGLTQKPALPDPWQTLGRQNNPGMPAYQATIGGVAGNGGWNTSPPAMPQQPQLGGVTRHGSQMIDANGQVIGHYGNQNEPIYNTGQGPSPFPGQPDWTPRGPDGNPDPRIKFGGGQMPPAFTVPEVNTPEWWQHHPGAQPGQQIPWDQVFGPDFNSAYAQPFQPSAYNLSNSLGPGGVGNPTQTTSKGTFGSYYVPMGPNEPRASGWV